MNRIGIVGWIVAVILGIILFFTHSCQKEKVVTQQIVTKKTDTIWLAGKIDTAFLKPDIQFIPTPGITDTIYTHDSVLVPAKPLTHGDSVEASKQFYAQNHYNDTLKGNQVTVALSEVISENKIKLLSYEIKNSRLTVENSSKSSSLKNKVFVGASVGYSVGLSTPFFSPVVAFQNKQDNIIFAGYDVFHQTYQLGGLLKIRIGK